jgi:hypothetical protein
MPQPIHAAERIRANLQGVAEMRRESAADPRLAEAVKTVKRLQARRFRGTYRDFSSHASTRPAMAFFLEELYGEHDFSRRDAQFQRIASALERLFPASVSELAVHLTEMPGVTERLDHQLAAAWLGLPDSRAESEAYVRAWRLCGARAERDRQLAVVQQMGRELQALTRKRSLRLGLRMMRGPAEAAGLDALQRFLEAGFDAFSALGDAGPFLAAVDTREQDWIHRLFDAPLDEVCRQLDQEWAKALP